VAWPAIQALRAEFWTNVSVPGSGSDLNSSLEKAGRCADFLEFAETMAKDALDRDESCGGHFRTEHQDDEGECVRNDDEYMHSSVWEYKGEGQEPVRHKEPLKFEYVKPTKRSYK
jgi:succinate dehydrogenase / fumarate reductase, flavoprotein subunit